jgi:acetylornithine deacetylase
MPSESRHPHGDQWKYKEFVEGYLAGLGCETDAFLPSDVPGSAERPAYLGGRSYEGRPNVVGKKAGVGGGGPPLLGAHGTRSRGEKTRGRWIFSLAPSKRGSNTGWASFT